MLDNIEMQIRNAFKSHEIKITSDDILDKAVDKAKFKRRPLFKGLIMAMSSLVVVSTVMAIVLIPKNHILSIEERVQQKSFIADVFNAVETLINNEDPSVKKVKKSMKYLENNILEGIEDIIKETIENAYENISQTFLYSLDKIEFNYDVKEEKNTITIAKQACEYNYVCELSNSVNYYYNLLEEDNELQGIIISKDLNMYLGNYIGINTKFNNDDYIFESRFTLYALNSEIFSYNVREKEDGTKEYSYCSIINKEEFFSYSIKKTKTKVEIKYKILEDTSIEFSIKNETNDAYKVDCNIKTHLSLFGDFETRLEFVVNYKDEYQGYELNEWKFNF